MPDKGLLKTLCALGAGFDCATTHEIELAISVGADVNRIIFAHPQKMPREITKAAQLGANLTTFDTGEGRREQASALCDAALGRWLCVGRGTLRAAMRAVPFIARSGPGQAFSAFVPRLSRPASVPAQWARSRRSPTPTSPRGSCCASAPTTRMPR